MGRSVGGRTAIEFPNTYPQKTLAVILQHPVVPNDGLVSGLKAFPTLLSWAKDDGKWDNQMGHATAGHPFYGPHGAAYVTNLSGCELLSWQETDYGNEGPRLFFRTVFVEKVVSFLNKHGL